MEHKMKLNPLGNNVLVKPTVVGEITKNGIIVPESVKEVPIQGTVIAVGPGMYSQQGILIPTTLKEGSTVLYGKYSGTVLELDDEGYLIIKEDELLGELVTA